MTIYLSILALLALLLVGCSDERAAATATATSTSAPRGAQGAAATITATAVRRPAQQRAAANSAAPTPTWTASATPQANAPTRHLLKTDAAFDTASPLDQAAYLHRIGDYTEEQRMLLARLADPEISSAQRQEAHYRLVLAYLANDQHAPALDTLEKFLLQAVSLPAEDPRRINSVFLRAEALAGLGRAAEAVAAYGTFLEQRPQVTGPVEESIADVWLAAGNWPRAANALRRAANEANDNGEKARLLERLAGAFEADGRWNDAAAVYDEILSFSVRPAYRVGILYRSGAAYAADGEEETAISRWQRTLAEAPRSYAAYQSLIQLVNRDIPVDLFLRGEIDLFVEAYLPAVRAFEQFLEQTPNAARAGQAWLGLGRAHLGLGQWDDARLAFDHVLNAYPTCVCFGEAWLARARLESARGAPAAGRRIYRTFARERPDDPLAPEALWRSALSSIAADNRLAAGAALQSDVDPFDEAAADLLVLADGFPDSARAPDALSVLGIGAFAHSRYAQSASSFGRLLADYPDARPGAATYWLGRSRYAQGEYDAARSLWQALAAREPDTFYGVLAAIALTSPQDEPGQDIFLRVGALWRRAAAPLADDDGSRAFAESWLAAWKKAPHREDLVWPPPGAMGRLPQAVARDPDLTGGELLLALERRVEGLKLLARVYLRYRDDPVALYPLMLRFDALGANQLSTSAAEYLILRSPAQRMADAPLFLQQTAYPRHFSRLVEEEATAFGIDPLLFYSLIRQESLFEPSARSIADAQGLAQIIPSTGAEIAERLNYPNYHVGLLMRPFVNIRFGAFYLRWVRDYALDSVVAALAGYNAGPGNARNWLERVAPDDALLVESIPFTEPRLYLQRILTHYYHYLRLYRA